MRKLNLAWLLGLGIGAVSLVVLTFVIHSFQVSKNALAFVREAKRAQAEKRGLDAIEHLQRYVKLAPNDPTGWILLGNQLSDVGKTESAILVLEQAIQRWPERNEVRRKLVDLAIEFDRYSDAMDQLKNHLLPASPDDSDLLEKLSDCQVAQGEFQEAEASLEAAISKNPSQLKSYVKLALLRHGKLNRPGDAIEPLNQMVLLNPDNHGAYFYRTQWLIQRINELKALLKVNRRLNVADLNSLIQQAVVDSTRALELAPDDADTILLGVQVAHESDRAEDAISLARRGIEIEPKGSRFYLILAELEVAESNLAGAIEVLRDGITAIPKDHEMKWVLGLTLVDAGEIAEASTIVEQLRAERYSEPLVHFLEGKMLIYSGEWLAAIRQLEAARAGLRDRPDLMKQIDYGLGTAYREIKSPEQELICFRRAAAVDPDWIPAQMALAETLMSAGFTNEAITLYRVVSSKSGNSQIGLLGLARTILVSNLRTKTESRDWSDFDNVLTQLEKQNFAPSQVAVMRAEKLIADNQREAAAALFVMARENNPENLELCVAQIGLAQLGREWDLVERLFQEANEKFGDVVVLRNQKGRYLMQRYRNEAEDQLRELSIANLNWTTADRLKLATAYAHIFLAIKDFDDAQRMGLIVSNEEPRNLSIRLLLLDVASRSKRPELMKDVLDEIHGITGEGAIWNYAKAFLITVLAREKFDNQNLDEALQYLKKSRILAPSWDRVPLLMAEIYETRKLTREASDQYIDSILLGERRTNIVSHVLSLLFYDRRFEEAEKLIRHLHDAQSTFTEEMARAEVDVSLQLGRKEDALRTAELLVQDSELSQDALWLGRVFIALEKPAEAEKQFRRAAAEKPTDPEPWVGLVRSLTLTGSIDKAEIAVDEAKQAISKELGLLTAGKCYEIMGKVEIARQNYQAAVDQAPRDLSTSRELADFLFRTGASAESEVVLRKMIDLATGRDEATVDHRLWAHRKLAMILSTKGDAAKLTESLSIIERNLKETSQKSSEDLRLKATILANGTSAAEHKQAMEILEKLLAQEPTGAVAMNDRFLLARLYLQIGDRGRARGELRKLISAQKDDPRFLNAYAQLSLQAGETNEAELYLNLLQKLVPDELSTVDLQVQILFAKGRYAELVNVLKGIGAAGIRGKRQTESLATSRLWAAKRLEEFARLLKADDKTEEAAHLTSASEFCFEKFVEERPEEMLVLAQFLAQTSGIDRALNLLQEHGPTSSPPHIANVALATTRNPRVTKAQLDRLQQLFDAYVATHERSLVLQETFVEMLSWRGEYSAAIAAYKTLLRTDERNLAVLNNLAVLTSLTVGDNVEAMRLLDKAIGYGGPIMELLDTRGLVHLAAGNPDKAVADFQLALSKRETAESRFHLAVALAKLKQFDLAREALERADALLISEHELHPLERTMLKTLRIDLKTHARSNQTPQARI